MTGDPTKARAARLERLLDDFSYRERRSPELLREIDALVREASRQGLLPNGASPEEVRAVLGPPHRILGEEGDETVDWHYPSLPPEAGRNEVREWSLVLRFRNDALAATEERPWREMP